jgi:tetratricopeptide (TPR) repeat protein
MIHEYVGLVYVGLPEARLGNVEAGASALRRAIGIAEQAGIWVLLGRAHGWLAEIELERQDADTALRCADAGLELSTRHGYLYDAALCERARGRALAALAHSAEAREHLSRAEAQFAAIGARPELERTRQAIASLR